MRFVPYILLILSFPAGILGYALAVRVLSALPVPEQVEGLVVMFVPLLVGGLFMMPFLIPFFDRKAKQDLEAYRRSKETSANDDSDTPAGERDR
jgi:hypothetical protein